MNYWNQKIQSSANKDKFAGNLLLFSVANNDACTGILLGSYVLCNCLPVRLTIPTMPPETSVSLFVLSGSFIKDLKCL